MLAAVGPGATILVLAPGLSTRCSGLYLLRPGARILRWRLAARSAGSGLRSNQHFGNFREPHACSRGPDGHVLVLHRKHLEHLECSL